MFAQQLVNGLTLGSIYALTALGYTLVYGILLLINFAHSEIFMAGAFMGLLGLHIGQSIPGIANSAPALLTFTFIFSMLGSALLGVAIEFIAYRPLRKADRLAPLISAIGVSIFLQNFVMLAVSRQQLHFPEILPRATFTVGNVTITNLQILIVGASFLLMLALHLFVSKSKLGKAMRACSQDMDAAALMGINVNFIISVTFFIGAALGGAAGVMNGMFYASVKYNMGFMLGIKAFTAAVMGGIGNIFGAMVGGILLGILEVMGTGYVSSEYKDVFAFVILIIVLILKPSGLFGKDDVEKV